MLWGIVFFHVKEVPRWQKWYLVMLNFCLFEYGQNLLFFYLLVSSMYLLLQINCLFMSFAFYVGWNLPHCFQSVNSDWVAVDLGFFSEIVFNH